MFAAIPAGMERDLRSYGRQLLQSRRGLILLAGALALVFIAMLWAVSRGRSDTGPATPPPVPVEVVSAARRDVPHVVEAVGTVQSLQAVTVRTQVDGFLTRILFREGDTVARGQLLATIDDRALSATLAAAQAQLSRDQAQLRLAELDLERYVNLLDRDAIARQTVDQQRAQVDQLRAAVALGRANVNAARVNLSFTRISVPVSGRVGIRQVDQGNLVRTSDAAGIVTVTQMDPISIVFPASQSILARLAANRDDPDARVVEAIDRETGKTLGQGEILALDNQIDAASGTARVRARFPNGAETLTPGAFVAVRVRTGHSPGAIVLPANVVRPGVEGPFVYRVERGVARRVPVSLGFHNDAVAVIARGVSVGDAIISDGYSRLRDGSPVSIVRRAAAGGTAR